MTHAAFEQVLERLQANPLLPSFALMHELGHAQLQLWRQIGGKAAKPIKRRERKPTLVSVARQVAKAELPAAADEFRPDGTIVAVVGKPNTVADETDDVTPEDRDQWPKSNSRSSISYHDPRNGHMRHQFRRKGCRRFMLKGKVGSAEFMAHYAELLAASEGPSPSRARPDTINALIGEYLEHATFKGLAETTRARRRGILNQFRIRDAERPTLRRQHAQGHRGKTLHRRH